MNSELSESYIFKTCGMIGFFHNDAEGFYIYLNTRNGLNPHLNPTRWTAGGTGDHVKSEEAVKSILSSQIGFMTSDLMTRTASDVTPLFPIDEIQKIEPTGQFPRLNRNNIKLSEMITSQKAYLDEGRYFKNLCRRVDDDIFYYIEPVSTNLDIYGHKIREVLILACTEVEYLFRQFLEENKYGWKPENHGTKDYVTCRDIFRLNEYAVELEFYPDLGPFKPFHGWDDSKSTQSLDWYAAYNGVKHNRGLNFERASLKQLIESLAAIHILLECQYGSDIVTDFKSVFKTTARPEWGLNYLFAPLFADRKMIWQSPKGYFEINKRGAFSKRSTEKASSRKGESQSK
jgi:hypothetical protein